MSGGGPDDSAVSAAFIADLQDAFGDVGPKGHESGPTLSPVYPTSSRPRFASELLPGTRLGDFQIIEELGRGGMGIVYRARQHRLGREVAVKVLPGAGRQLGRAAQRFRSEAKVIARLNHPNIVPLFEDGESDGHLYFAMALVHGCSLDVALHSRPELLTSGGIKAEAPRSGSAASTDKSFPASDSESDLDSSSTVDVARPTRTLQDYRRLAELMADVADGLSHAHENGVIHRDVKPQNILIAGQGRAYITDFGLSLFAEQPHLTLTGEVMGTPAYLSPEQIRGNGVDQRTDIYSSGVTLYELLTGVRPFRGENRDQVMHAICSAEPLPPRRIHRQIPIDLETICLRAMEKEAGKRYGTAAELAADLRRFVQGSSISARRKGLGGKAVSFAGRHRGGCLVGGMFAITAFVAAGLLASVTAGRRNQADLLLQTVFDQLVYLDYRNPERVAADIARAETLGADPRRLQLVRAIADLGAGRNDEAADRLEALLRDHPAAIAETYLLAWAKWRKNDFAGARQTFDSAEASGGPSAAADWFFRGLAGHFDRPPVAIESYRRANELRAAQRQFFPQSVLHLARAYNQQTYGQRTSQYVSDAADILRQLIAQQHYGAFPHYLLSINQRLAGEIQLRVDPQATDFARVLFEEALQLARQGQLRDPTDDRPITAEAEALERLGRYDEAVAARTRAIAAAKQDSKRCEGHHYRWRLHYWLSEYGPALSDIQVHAACMPESIFYAHVYPSWIYADQGDMARAVEQARQIAMRAPDDAQAVMWSAASLRILGHAEEAQQLLLDRRAGVDFATGLTPPQTPDWVQLLYEFATGAADVNALLGLADSVQDSRKLRAEAFFHAAIVELASGDRLQARELLQQAYDCFDSELRYTFHAQALLGRMQMDDQWPAWLPDAAVRAGEQ